MTSSVGQWTSPGGGPGHKTSLSDYVVGELERRILSGELRPGDRVPTEAEIGDELGVSRSVIRDAMRTLAARQLIEVRHGHGTEVAQPTHAAYAHAMADLMMRLDMQVGEILDARAALERQLAPLAAQNATDRDLTEMADRLTAYAGAVERGDELVAHEAHLEFHLGLVRAMHLPALELFLKPIDEVILLTSIPPDTASWEVASHQPILDALRARDQEALQAAIAEHYDVLRSPQYDRFAAMRLRDLVTHDDFSLIRQRITARSARTAQQDSKAAAEAAETR